MNTGEPLAEGHLLDGRYRVRKVIGVGGMGRVYLANDTRLANRPVAAKEMILGDGIAEKKAIEDFTREASVLARLSHPGIPIVIDHFAERARHYLIMEFVAGGDLEQLLERSGSGGRFAEYEVVKWARQILEVLDFLHAQNPQIIYRDLKPGNIMIDKDGRAMLIDFGIARFLPKSGRATQIGSPGYAPPEQYAGRVDARSDIYSLAATMHHTLTGRDPRLEPPFSFPPVRDLAPEVSIKTAAAVDRALSHDAAQRFAAAREMLHSLPTLDELPSGAPLPAYRSGSLGSMATIALPNAGASLSRSKTPATLRPAAPATPIRSKSPTPRKIAQPRLSNKGASSASQTPTVVLNTPAPASAPSAPIAVKLSPHVKKAIELGGKAVALIERGLKSASAVLPADGTSSVSSTAKTQDLSPRQSGASANGARPPSSPPATPTLFPSQTVAEEPARVTAKLVARTENLEFALKLTNTVIGRAEQPGDAPDVDLAALKHGAERVSRRHAEVLRRGEDYFIRDLGSLNGTFVAGRGRLGRDQLYKLKDRDQVVLGGAILQFRRG